MLAVIFAVLATGIPIAAVTQKTTDDNSTYFVVSTLHPQKRDAPEYPNATEVFAAATPTVALQKRDVEASTLPTGLNGTSTAATSHGLAERDVGTTYLAQPSSPAAPTSTSGTRQRRDVQESSTVGVSTAASTTKDVVKREAESSSPLPSLATTTSHPAPQKREVQGSSFATEPTVTGSTPSKGLVKRAVDDTLSTTQGAVPSTTEGASTTEDASVLVYVSAEPRGSLFKRQANDVTVSTASSTVAATLKLHKRVVAEFTTLSSNVTSPTTVRIVERDVGTTVGQTNTTAQGNATTSATL